MLCHWVSSYRYFEWSQCHHLQSQAFVLAHLILKMKALWFLETLETTHPTTQRHTHKISVLWKTHIPTEECAGSFAHLTHEEYELQDKLDKPQCQTYWHKSRTVRTFTAMEILKNVLLYKEKTTAALHK